MTNACIHLSSAVYEEVQNTWITMRRVKSNCIGDCDKGHVSLKQISFCLICQLISIPHFLSLSQGREYKTKITSVQIHCFKFIWKAGLSYRESGFSLLVMLCYYSPNILGLLHDFQSSELLTYSCFLQERSKRSNQKVTV